MARETSRGFAMLMMVLGVLSLLASLLPAGFTYRALTSETDYARDTDVEDFAAGEVHEGDSVHLRSLRDAARSYRLADGRVLHPSAEDPHVMVECGPDDCAGYLVGVVEELHLDGGAPPEWPIPPGERVWIVHVGVLSAQARSHAILASVMASLLLLLGLACAGLGVLGLSRGRGREPRG